MQEISNSPHQAVRTEPCGGAPGPLHSASVPPAGGPQSRARLREIARERGRLRGEIECLEAELFRVNLRRALRPAELLPETARRALGRYVQKRRQLAALQLELQDLQAS